jgi:hypothetical protein
MKTTSALALLALLGLLGGCSTSPSEPTSGSSHPSTTSATVGIPTISSSTSDVVPQTIYVRPALGVTHQLVTLSNVLPPSDLLGVGLDAPQTTHTDVLRIAPQGVAASYAIPIDTVADEAYLFLGPQTNDPAVMDAALRDTVVLDPNGVAINTRATKSATHDATHDLAMSAIPLAGHPVGTYTVAFKSGAPSVGVAIEARLLASTIVMKLQPSTLEHLYGNQSSVDATLFDGSTPITGARVVADLVDGETGVTVAPIAFTEIGGGVYRAQLESVLGPSSKVSAYLTDVRAEGTTPAGTAFARHGRTGFHFGVPTARLSGVVAQRTMTDDTGLVSAFEVDVALDSASLDRLEVSAKLTTVGTDGQEHPISIAHTGDAYDAGHHVVTLHFDAGQLRLTKAEGNFMVRELSLFSLGTNTLFHRELSGENRAFTGIARASLRPLATLTAAQAQLVTDGVLSND